MSTSRKQQFNIKQTLKYRRYYKTFVVGSGAFLLAFVFASIFTPVQNSDAAQLVNIENVDTGYYVSVSGSAELNVSTSTTPEGALFGATDTITTTTNSPRGYQLYISASPNYLYLNGDPSTSSQGKFLPIGGSLTNSVALGTNTWGFAFNPANVGVVANNFQNASAYVPDGSSSETDDTIIPSGSATYTSVPTTETMIQEISSANLPNGTDLNVYFGFKANTGLPSGTYSGAITYTAISDGVNNNTEFMQDFTTTECASMSVGQRIELMDKRDLKWYYVSKLADGNCWMTSNLALDGGRTLTPEDSNVTENRTLPASANITSGTPTSYDVPQIYTANAESADDYGTKYGNLYNYSAVTATTGNAYNADTIYESVCPKGWRLPDIGTSYTITFGNLLSKYTDDNGDAIPATGNYDSKMAVVSRVQKAPLYFPLAGIYASSTASNSGVYGSYWSRTPGESKDGGGYQYIFGLFLNNQNRGSYYAQGGFQRNRGYSVRCVFEGSFDTIANMQEMSTSICKATAEATTAVLPDNRDSNSYRVAKLPDGNCWTTQNMKYETSGSVANQNGYDGRLYTYEQANSTCPAGWTLPPRSGDKSYENLFSGRVTDYSGAEAIPYLFTRAGKYVSGSYSDQNTYGDYWTATSSDSQFALAYFFYYSTSRFGTQGLSNKTDYYSVRCVVD